MQRTRRFFSQRFLVLWLASLAVIFFTPWSGQAAKTKILHSFAFGATDGSYPQGDLTRAWTGHTFYGMSHDGGACGYGAIFSFDPGGNTFQILHSFMSGATDGAGPYGSLTLAPDGHTLYGMTSSGGSSNLGTIFKFDTSTNTIQLLHSFAGGDNDGEWPEGSLTLSGDGLYLYGLTHGGGSNDDGTIFKFNLTTNTIQVLYSFAGGASDGRSPTGSLTFGADGRTLYGLTPNGGNVGSFGDYGTIFSYNTSTNTYQVLYFFQDRTTDGAWPEGSLTLSPDGLALYGMARVAGANGKGSIFRLRLSDNTFWYLYGFAGGASDGDTPWGSLTFSADGLSLYGMTRNGGSSDYGTVFKFDPNTLKVQVLHSLAGGAGDGRDPFGSLTRDGSILYGMTKQGGTGDEGTIIKYDTGTNSFSLLHSFAPQATDGVYPTASPTFSGDGLSLYGMTLQGGAGNVGTIFKYTPGTGSYTLLRSFTGSTADPWVPSGSLTRAAAGNILYGLSRGGGSAWFGTLFSYNPGSDTLQILHNFAGGTSDGDCPCGSLTLAPDGQNLYGMTLQGGTNHNRGTIFKFDLSANNFQVLHSFGGDGDGYLPIGSLILMPDGHSLYGLTPNGGSSGYGDGVMFRYDLSTSSYQLLRSFAGGSADGRWPKGSLTLGGDGHTLYGLTQNGGPSDKGTIFSYDTATGSYQVLYSFSGAADGSRPQGDLTLSKDGRALYGMTSQGGSQNYGAIFSFTPGSNTFRLLYSFTGEPGDGKYPQGSLTLSPDGRTLYGMTHDGGSNNDGVLFSFDLARNCIAPITALLLAN